MKLPRLATSTNLRSRRSFQAYQQYKKQHSDLCDFCHVAQSASTILSEHKLFMVVTNAFPYEVWDGGCRVLDHIMLVPKRHMESITLFTPDEQQEYMQVLTLYEHQGYDYYARSPGNAYKSVAHQHTHLIKLEQPTQLQFRIGRQTISLFK